MRDPIILLVYLIATLARLMAQAVYGLSWTNRSWSRINCSSSSARDTGRRISARRIGPSPVSVRYSCARLVCSARRSCWLPYVTLVPGADNLPV